MKRAAERLGPPDILVNNAGVYGPKGPSEEVDWDDWKQAVEVNLFGVMLPCRAVIPYFKQAGRGKIINLSGGGATAPLPRLSAYAVSKAAVVRLTETLAEELRADHIDVNAIAPGALNTRLLDEVLAAGPEKVGADFYTRSVQQQKERRRGAGAGCGAMRLPGQRRKRWHHGQADQRAVGSLEKPGQSSRRSRRHRHLYVAPDRAKRPGQGLGGRMIRYGLIGAGLIGKKRLACLDREQVVGVCDLDLGRARALAGEDGGRIVTDQPEVLFAHPAIDAIIIATLHDSLAPLALRAIRAGKHVLVEKPAGRNAAELRPLIAEADARQVTVRVGYNHRFHPTFQLARRLVDEGGLGPLMFLRAPLRAWRAAWL